MSATERPESSPPARTARRACIECEGPLKQGLQEGVEIDFCPDCLSVWLDREEFERLVDRMRGPEVDPVMYWAGHDASEDASRRAVYLARPAGWHRPRSHDKHTEARSTRCT